MLPVPQTRCLTPNRNSDKSSTPSMGHSVDPRIGANVGSLSIIQQIGGGGMGSVYEAHHRHLDRRVAIKFLRSDCTSSTEADARFERESRSIAQIDHPNVLRALDAGVWQGQRYVVTEMLDGLDLQHYVDRYGQVDSLTSMEWIRQAASGLHAVHQLGLIHRDIKPSNLFLSQNSIIKLIDFGIVRGAQPDATSTQDGQLLGTVDYLSPEQATAPNNADASCDIYSLGCVWIFLLSGKTPFPDALYPGFMPKLKGHMADLPPWLNSSDGKQLPKPKSHVRSVKIKPRSSKSSWSGFPHSSLQESPE
ncbi:serine/threonine protein kinase [Pirellulaceae bacterium SH501]